MNTTHATWFEKLLKVLFYGFCTLVFLFLIIPVFVIIPLSFNGSQYLVYPMDGFSLKWYAQLFTAPEWMRAFKNSMIIAPLATVLAMVLGVLASIGLTKYNFPFKSWILAIIISPMIVPVVIVGVASYIYFAPLNMVNSYTSLVVLHAALGVPFVVLTVSATLQSYNQTLSHAAASLGAGPITTFFKITVPVIYPGVISGGLFAFATSFDEVVVTLFMAGPQQATLPRQMFSGLKENLSPTLAAAATLLITFSVIMLLSLEWIRRKAEKTRQAAT